MLNIEEIRVGKVIWWSGQKGKYDWSCPAIIRMVDFEHRVFWLHSLDRMRDIPEPYSFDVPEWGPHERRTMRDPKPMEVQSYIRRVRASRQSTIALYEGHVKTLTTNMNEFEAAVATLPIAYRAGAAA